MLWGVINIKSFDLKTIALRDFCINMLFSYFWVSYNIVKFHTAMVHSLSGQRDSVNTKCLFFLGVGWMPAASRDSIQFHTVSL